MPGDFFTEASWISTTTLKFSYSLNFSANFPLSFDRQIMIPLFFHFSLKMPKLIIVKQKNCTTTKAKCGAKIEANTWVNFVWAAIEKNSNVRLFYTGRTSKSLLNFLFSSFFVQLITWKTKRSYFINILCVWKQLGGSMGELIRIAEEFAGNRW